MNLTIGQIEKGRKLISELGIDSLDAVGTLHLYLGQMEANALLPRFGYDMKATVDSDEFSKILRRFEIKYVSPVIFKLPDIFERLEAWNQYLLENDLVDYRNFIDAFFPYLVVERERFFSIFKPNDAKGKQVRALLLLLECEPSNEEMLENLLPGLSQLQNYSTEIQTIWCERLGFSDEQFAEAWYAVFLCRFERSSVKISGSISSVIRYCKKNQVPYSQVLEFYYDTKKHRSRLETAVSPWAVLNKEIKGIPVESGLSKEEAFFNIGIWKMKEKKPSDVIRALFYPTSRNTSGFDCGFLYQSFSSKMNSKTATALVVNPSPDFLLTAASDENINLANICFAVTDHVVAELYRMEFPESEFVPFEEIDTIARRDVVLIMSRDLPKEKIDQMLVSLSATNESAEVFAVLPNAYIDADPARIKKILAENESIVDAIIELPTEVTVKTAGKKKVLLHIKKSEGAIGQTDIAVYTMMFDGARIWLPKKIARISIDQFFSAEGTIKSKLKNVFLPKEETNVKSREHAKSYLFSKEIDIHYTVRPILKHTRYAGKAYYCTAITSAKKRRRGKRISEVVERNLHGKTKEEVIQKMELVPFDSKVNEVIVEDIRVAYENKLSTLSLKTVWFCCRNALIANTNYDDDIARSLFCSQSRALADLIPGESGEAEYIVCMEEFFKNDAYGSAAQLKHWRQLSLILNEAIKEGYFAFNPLYQVIAKLSNQATAEQREVRNALTKKSFEADEEQRIINHIMEETSIQIGPRKAKRYEVDSMVLAGAIRLFTGMSGREVCALTWSDMRPFIEGCYQFVITKFINNQGEPEFTPIERNWKKFRLIPIPSLLVEMLLARKTYLLLQGGVTEKELADQAIVTMKNIRGADRKFCKPRHILKECKALVQVAGIQPEIIYLPDEKGGKELDMNKYQGDIFQSNFRYHANHASWLNRGELNYLLGIEPPDTFSKHYCDYTNDLVQYTMLQKLNRWIGNYGLQCQREHNSMFKSMIMKDKDYIVIPGTDGVSKTEILLTVPQGAEGTVTLSISSEMGFEGGAIRYGRESANKKSIGK